MKFVMTRNLWSQYIFSGKNLISHDPFFIANSKLPMHIFARLEIKCIQFILVRNPIYDNALEIYLVT
jgi:hypothetical protein